jgi:hypothetical protein
MKHYRISVISASIVFLTGFNVAVGVAIAATSPPVEERRGRVWEAPCPPSCPGTRPLDTDEATFTCCRGGACRVCHACPFNPFC